MAKLKIDNREVEAEAGATLLDAAHALGIEIPTLCFLDREHSPTSCFVCVVKLKGRPGLVPACATAALDGMDVESETDEVRDARRTALELLLSDHLGDCIGPCHAVCPAHMNIPRMIRQIAAGQLREAIVTVKEAIALPAVLGRICPAPCEKGCRRGQHDAPLAICLLKRHVADVDLAAGDPWLPPCEPETGKRVAIAGAGPTGLAAAWYLLQQGHAAWVFDDHPKPGGMLQYGVPEESLPRDALDAEIAAVTRLGAELRLGTRVGRDVPMDVLRRDFDAVLLAVGQLKEGDAEALGVPASKQAIEADRHTFATPVQGVFAAGCTFRQQKMAVRAVADGRAAADSIDFFLSSSSHAARGTRHAGSGVRCQVSGVGGPEERRTESDDSSTPGSDHASRVTRHDFSTHIGKLKDGEMPAFLEGVSSGGQVTASGGFAAGFTEAEAREESARCLHCDCRKPVSCKLRRWAVAYDASPSRYKADRRTFEQQATHPDILYEPGKCIRCGICVQLCADAKEELGLTFIGRGFDVVVGVPFSRPIADGLRKVAAACAAACPTGPLALRNAPETNEP